MIMRIVMITTGIFFLLFLYPDSGRASVSISANNAILMDELTGRVLYEKNAHDQRPIASITKIMTAIIAIEQGDLKDPVKISERAVKTEGSSIYLKAGQTMSLEELLYGLMLRSGNDAAIAIAEHIGGSVEGFVLLMNNKARQLGMNHTNFKNPHGLYEEDHYSTAYDMALLTRYAMQDKTYKMITKTSFYKPISLTYGWKNKHRLINGMYRYSTGGKTGYTRNSGRTLVTSATKNDLDLIVVTLNAPSDWNDHITLFEWGFNNFRLEKLIEKGKTIYPIKDFDDFLEGHIYEDVLFPIHIQEINKLKKHSYILQKNKNNESIIGKTVITLDGIPIANVFIYDTPIEETSIVKYIYKNMLKISGIHKNG